MDDVKPFAISKREVWEAYKRVRANQGAAGVDEESLAEFAEDLTNNLYKLWNRMVPGSYFPPPVLTTRCSGAFPPGGSLDPPGLLSSRPFLP